MPKNCIFICVYEKKAVLLHPLSEKNGEIYRGVEQW